MDGRICFVDGRQVSRRRHVARDDCLSTVHFLKFPENRFEVLKLLENSVEMSADVARGHGGDGGGDDRPPPHQIPTGRAYENQFAGSGGRAGKAAIPPGGPVNLRLAHLTVSMRLHWANYLGELVRELSLHHPSWRQMPPEQKAGVMARIGLVIASPHDIRSLAILSSARPSAKHIQKIYNGIKDCFLRGKGIRFPELGRGNYDLDTLSDNTSLAQFRGQLGCEFCDFGMIHKDEMLRLQGLGSNTETGVPYTEDEIMAIVRGGKQRGHIPGVGRVLPGQRTVILPPTHDYTTKHSL
ncbi:hypothetical protein Tco_1409597 [Tanacetum coccineum]